MNRLALGYPDSAAPPTGRRRITAKTTCISTYVTVLLRQTKTATPTPASQGPPTQPTPRQATRAGTRGQERRGAKREPPRGMSPSPPAKGDGTQRPKGADPRETAPRPPPTQKPPPKKPAPRPSQARNPRPPSMVTVALTKNAYLCWGISPAFCGIYLGARLPPSLFWQQLGGARHLPSLAAKVHVTPRRGNLCAISLEPAPLALSWHVLESQSVHNFT